MKSKSVAAVKSRSSSVWQWLAIVLLMILVPWAGYITYHPSFSSLITPLTQSKEIDIIAKGIESTSSLEIAKKSPVGSTEDSEEEETKIISRKEIEKSDPNDDEKPIKPKKNAKKKIVEEVEEEQPEENELEIEPVKTKAVPKKKKKKAIEETDEEQKQDEEVESEVRKPVKKAAKKKKVVEAADDEQGGTAHSSEDAGVIEAVEVKPSKTDKKTKKKEDKKNLSKSSSKKVKQVFADKTSWIPILGEIPMGGTQPLYGVKHQGGDAIFALACNYPKNFYQRFVGSLRKAEYEGDIVLAVSPPEKMKPGVEQYIKKTKVVGYAFDVDCIGKDNCKLKDDFLGYPDPRPHRTFANIRYALYEYWLRQYSETSYILILDFRDTFFQLDPFAQFGPVESRTPKYDLRLYAENFKVKSIGKCVYNSLWVGRCFGKPALAELREKAVICSGSTLGSYQAILHYIQTMLKSMDSVKCWLKGIESDQGYQNYLFYNGYFHTDAGNATLFQQGEDVVNTIGAMNGFRVPKEMKGPLDTHWKIRDKEGYILNNDGTRSACVHQWDRWYSEVVKFLDTKLY